MFVLNIKLMFINLDGEAVEEPITSWVPISSRTKVLWLFGQRKSSRRYSRIGCLHNNRGMTGRRHLINLLWKKRQFYFYSKTELIFLSDFQPAIVGQPLISVLISSMRIKTGTPRFLGNRHHYHSNFWFINGVDNVNWPPYRDWKADVSSVSPSSERIDELWVV